MTCYYALVRSEDKAVRRMLEEINISRKLEVWTTVDTSRYVAQLLREDLLSLIVK